MREHLVGYLLGALDPAEVAAVELRLERDPQLRHELEVLRAKLLPLADADEPDVEPPEGLAARTCRYVMSRVGPRAGQFAASSQWRPQDVLVAAGILVVASMLISPALLNGRSSAQLRICQQNLATLGRALNDYSQYHDGSFPVVPAEGNLAAAGIYAPILWESGLIEAHDVVCPSSTLASELADEPAEFRIPTLAEVQTASHAQRARLHRRMGGSYGYSLGYIHHGQYHGLRNRARASFALMADAPGQHAPAGSPNHGSAGQNVLFEDGHVKFLKHCIADGEDHIFQNNLGYVGAGIGPHDSVIASSASAPVILLQAPASP
jgi:hypothetical protein